MRLEGIYYGFDSDDSEHIIFVERFRSAVDRIEGRKGEPVEVRLPYNASGKDEPALMPSFGDRIYVEFNRAE